MSRQFNGTNSDYLDLSTLAVTTLPFTIAVWYKPGSLGVSARIFNVGTAASTDNDRYIGTTIGDNVQAISRTTTNASGTSTTAMANTTDWNLLTAVFTSDSSRAAFLNGAGKNTNATANAPTTPNYIILAAAPGITNRVPANSKLAHAAIWSVALSDAEVLSLVTNKPSAVQASNLQEYWPLDNNNSPETSFGVSPHSLTVHGTTFSTDDPYPVTALPPQLFIGVRRVFVNDVITQN